MFSCKMDKTGITIEGYRIPISGVTNKEELPLTPITGTVSFQIQQVIAKIPIASRSAGGFMHNRLNIYHCSWIDCRFYLKGIKY